MLSADIWKQFLEMTFERKRWCSPAKWWLFSKEKTLKAPIRPNRFARLISC